MANVKIDEMLRLVRDEATKVPAHNAVPSGPLAFVKSAFDVVGNVLFDVELVHRFLGDIDGLLLHVFTHVCTLDLGFETFCGVSPRDLLVRRHLGIHRLDLEFCKHKISVV